MEKKTRAPYTTLPYIIEPFRVRLPTALQYPDPFLPGGGKVTEKKQHSGEILTHTHTPSKDVLQCTRILSRYECVVPGGSKSW